MRVSRDSLRLMAKKGLIGKDRYIVSNGYKRKQYQQLITDMANEVYNVLPVLDNKTEIDYYAKHIKAPKMKIGIRIASESVWYRRWRSGTLRRYLPWTTGSWRTNDPRWDALPSPSETP